MLESQDATNGPHIKHLTAVGEVRSVVRWFLLCLFESFGGEKRACIDEAATGMVSDW